MGRSGLYTAGANELGNETFEQLWFAGNHADIGGSYPDNKSRLSDIALDWVVGCATSLPHPLVVDQSHLHRHPNSSGMQHDECKAGIKYVTRFTGKTWDLLHRAMPKGSPTIHPSVRGRFDAGPVLQYDLSGPYRPETFRVLDAYSGCFDGLPFGDCQCATCRQIRGLPPLPTLKSRLAAIWARLTAAFEWLWRVG